MTTDCNSSSLFRLDMKCIASWDSTQRTDNSCFHIYLPLTLIIVIYFNICWNAIS